MAWSRTKGPTTWVQAPSPYLGMNALIKQEVYGILFTEQQFVVVMNRTTNTAFVQTQHTDTTLKETILFFIQPPPL